MADENENRKTYIIGAFDLPTAEKYVRFLNKHTNFGGHTGLPKEMRNKNPNHSLDFSLGIYQTVDVYAIPPNKCFIGDVVNFYKDNTMNPEGITYVYPCENTDAPMGYMISNTSADVVGICLVHGVIEVPLVYPKNSSYSNVVKKDYVQYDIERGAFDFADSGYPVFNVYQDVDGDWIAIILFGNTSADWQYDGPFATTIAGVTGSTMYVNIAEGDVVDDNSRYTCDAVVYGDEDLTDDICLNTGETLWLGVWQDVITGSTYSYIVSSSRYLVDVDGHTVYHRIAENDNGKLRQLQYGDIIDYNEDLPYKGPFDVELLSTIPIYEQGHVEGMTGQYSIRDTSRAHLDSVLLAGYVIIENQQIPISGSVLENFTCEHDTVADLCLYKDRSDGFYKLKVVGRTNDNAGWASLSGTFYTRIATFTVGGGFIQLQYGDIVQPQFVSGSTVSGDSQDLYSATKAITGTTVYSPAICITDSNDYVNIVGGTNTYVTRGIYGEIIVGSTYSYNPTYQDLTSSVTGGTASVGITGSNSKVNFEGMGNNYITKIRSNATIEERQSWGTHYNSETGEYELKDAGWRGIIPLKIFDNFSYDSGIMTEVSMLSEVDGLTVSYPLIVPDTTDEELSIIADVSLGKISTSDIPKYLIDKALYFALDRISNDKSPYYNSTLEDPDDEALRNIPNADNIIVYGVVPALSLYVSGNTSATLGIYGTTNTVTFFAGENTTITGGTDGEIIINSVGGGGGGGSINNEYVLLTGATVHDLIAGNRYIVLCPRVFVGGVLRNQYNSETTIRNALINSGHTNVPSTGYSDDKGNMMLVLPENLTNQTSVEVKVNTKGCSVLVVTADSKKIILADSDGEQGVNAGVYTTEIRPTDTNEHWLFVYTNGVSWPSSYYDEIHGSIIQQAISEDGGCWILIPM